MNSKPNANKSADKTTPATQAAPEKTEPKTESAASKASRTAPIDLSVLTPTAAPAPKVAAGAGRKAADNSVAERWLTDSWKAREGDAKVGSGLAITVPTAAVGSVKSKLNTAAATLNLGVTIATEDKADGSTVVTFAAKVRKQKKAKTNTDQPTADAPAEAK